MARIIEERWVGVGFDVITEHLQVAKDGQPLHDSNGLPKTMEHTTLVFVINLPDGQRIVRIPFTPEGKQELVSKLTGGIVIPNGAHGG